MMRRQQQPIQRRRHQDHQSKVFYDLSSLVLSLLRSPPPAPIEFSDSPVVDDSVLRPARAAEISPAGFAALMLGVSMALMLCGSVTFFIGFLLMPWVIGLFFVFYIVGVVSTISVLGRLAAAV